MQLRLVASRPRLHHASGPHLAPLSGHVRGEVFGGRLAEHFDDAVAPESHPHRLEEAFGAIARVAGYLLLTSLLVVASVAAIASVRIGG